MKEYRLPFREWLKKDFDFYRTRQTFSQIKKHIKGNKIIDIGSGEGHLSKILKDESFYIKSIDIKNKNKILDIDFQVYDGINIPFDTNSFDTGLLMTVLHHTKYPNQLIQEAFRVSDRLIIIEDIFETKYEKYKTFILDSIFNFEFFNHPHTNKTDTGWKKYFKENNIDLIAKDYWITKTPLGNIRQVLYCVELN